MHNILNTDQQIQKLAFLEQLAKGKHDSELLAKLGSVVIYNGLVEIWAVQAARLLEQILLKSQLHEGKQPNFTPHEDVWFYDNQISTRTILKEIKRFLPLKDTKSGQKYDEEVENFLNEANEFLNYRNSLIHRLASPRTDLEDIKHCCDKLIEIYQQVVKKQGIMFETLGQYRFSEKEIEYFYGKRGKKEIN